MSSLIWTLHLLMLASTGLCEIPAPVNLFISSHNFIHLLTWEPGPGSPDRLSYEVEVYSLGNVTLLHLPGCKEVVSPLLCNLTEVLTNLKDSYYASVWAKLGNQRSNATELEAFIPMDHTELDPPLLSVRVCGNSLCMGLRPPSSQLHHVYKSLRYMLTVENSQDGAQYTLYTKGLDGENITDLEPGRKYCVTVTIADRKKSASSQPQCAETAVLSSSDGVISIILCLLVLMVLAVMFFLVYTGFFCLRTNIPEILITLKSQDVPLFPSTYDKIVYSLVLEAKIKSPPVAGDQMQGSRRNSAYEEDEEAKSTGDAGYERRPGRANQISCSDGFSSGSPPLADGHIQPSKFGCCNVPLTSTDSQDLSVTASGSLLLSFTGEGPLTGCSTVSVPPSESVADHGPLSLSLTGERPLSVSVAENEPWPLSSTTVGLLPASEDDIIQGDEEGSCLNVNLGSLMLAGLEDDKEDKEEEDKHKPFLLGVSSEPFLVLPMSSAVTEPSHTQAYAIYSKEEPEEDDEEGEDDDEDFSGYMKRPN